MLVFWCASFRSFASHLVLQFLRHITMSGITKHLEPHGELPERFVRFLRTVPNLGDSVAAQMAEFIEDMRDTVELIQDRTEEIDKLKNQLIVAHETIESLRNSIQETREARDESLNEVADNWEKDVKRYSQQLDDVVREKNFLSVRVGELEDDAKVHEAEKKNLEEELKNGRQRCTRCWADCGLLDETGDGQGVDDFDETSPARSRAKLGTSLSPLDASGCEIDLEELNGRIVRLTEQNRELEEGNQKLRDENDELYRQLEESSVGTPPGLLFGGEEGDFGSPIRHRSNLLEQLEAVEATPDRSFLRATRSRTGISSDYTNWVLPEMSNAENQTTFLDASDMTSNQCDTPLLSPTAQSSSFFFPPRSSLLKGVMLVALYFLVDIILFSIAGIRILAWSPSRFEGPVY